MQASIKKIGNMTFCITPDEESMAQRAAEVMLEQIKRKSCSLITIATGNTPTRSYELLVKMIRKQGVDISKLRIHKLDEWYGIPMDHPSTCEAYLQDKIVKPMEISKDRYYSIQSQPDDPHEACRQMANRLREDGPIDLCILGLGANGHLGLNEPADAVMADTHCCELTPSSRQHTMLQDEKTTVDKGLTTGMGEILAAKQILFLVSGKKKAPLMNTFLSRKVTTQYPASFLWLHPSVTCICDAEAATEIMDKL